MNKINSILAKFQDQPALVGEGSQAWFESCSHKAAEIMESLEPVAASSDFWFDPSDRMARYRPYTVRGGVLQIPIYGILMNNLPYQLGEWATGYEYVLEAMKRGVADPEVKGIALLMNSVGGAVVGNFELNDKMFEMRGKKPIRAFVSEDCYSAAYSLASAADDITVGRSGGVGSIGIVAIHIEMSKRLEESGITATIVRSKPRKMEGNSYEALTPAARKKMQSRIDETHKEFVALVARNRGISEGDVDATDALTFSASEAIENGLADFAGSFDDAITAFMASFSEGDNDMATDTKAPVITAEDLATAVAEATASERTRIQTILGSDVAKKRQTAAMAVALDTAMTADEAATFLGKMPEEQEPAVEPDAAAAATAATTPTPAPGVGVPAAIFDAAMGNTPNPEVGAGDEAATGGDPAETAARDQSQLLRSFGLPGFKTKAKE